MTNTTNTKTNLENLETLKAKQLKELAKVNGVKNWWLLKKEELLKELNHIKALEEEKIIAEVQEELDNTYKPETLTYLEHKVLSYFTECNFYTGDLECSLWTDCFLDELGLPTKQTRAILTTLGTKGLIEVQGKGRDSQLWLTDKGIEWTKKYLNNEIEAPKKEKKETPEGNKKEKTEEPEIDNDNLITLKELIMEAKIKGTKARRLLRNSTIDRPYKRWEWDKDLHSDIIDEVRKLFKK